VPLAWLRPPAPIRPAERQRRRDRARPSARRLGRQADDDLVHALHARGARYGLQTMCEGGGLANVTIVERMWRQRSGRDPVAWPYLVMGWLGAAAVVPLTQALGTGGLLWLLAGGALYSAGVLFYANDRRWRHAHGIWHLFVLAGSAAHVVTVLAYVD
jgi:predicted membrane channel-forming protein YqfA (hemolysin III family)